MNIDGDQLEEDEEESLVYVEFESTSGPDVFCNEKLQLDMIGLDTEHPIMRVNGRHYVGTYEDAIGTFMFFDKENDPQIDDPVFDKPSTLRYYKKSRKILKMKRVFVNPRLEILGDSNHPKCIPNLETIKEAGVPLNYQKDALSVWEKMRKEAIEVRNDYLEKQKKRKEKRQRGIEPESESDEDNYYVSMYKSKVENDKNKDKNIQESDKTTSRVSNKTRPSTSKDYRSDASFENDKVTDESEDQEDPEISASGDETSQQTRSNLIPKDVMDDGEINPEVEGMDIETFVPGTSTTSVDNVKLEQNSFEINQEETCENISNPKSDEEGDSPTLSVAQKHEKQQKREAKMQEITERFRRSANLIKLKSDQTKD